MEISEKANLTDIYSKSHIDSSIAAKQDTLVSGTNIKTINSQSIIGSGDITISGGAIIDDTDTSTGKTWSSSKINSKKLIMSVGPTYAGYYEFNFDTNTSQSKLDGFLAQAFDSSVAESIHFVMQDGGMNFKINMWPYSDAHSETITSLEGTRTYTIDKVALKITMNDPQFISFGKADQNGDIISIYISHMPSGPTTEHLEYLYECVTSHYEDKMSISGERFEDDMMSVYLWGRARYEGYYNGLNRWWSDA